MSPQVQMNRAIRPCGLTRTTWRLLTVGSSPQHAHDEERRPEADEPTPECVRPPHYGITRISAPGNAAAMSAISCVNVSATALVTCGVSRSMIVETAATDPG